MTTPGLAYCAGRLYDSVQAWGVPELGPEDLAAGYETGGLVSFPGLRDRFGWRVLSIDVTGRSFGADVVDLERGDASPAELPNWLKVHNEGRPTGVVYCSYSRWDEARRAAGSIPCLWWVAEWTGSPHLPLGADACQFATSPAYDVSVFSPAFVERLDLPVSTDLDPAFGPQEAATPGGPVFNGLALDRQDDFFATLRVLWNQYRTDPLTEPDQNLYFLAFELPITSPGSFAGRMDLVIAHLVDDARKKGVLRSFYAEGAV